MPLSLGAILSRLPSHISVYDANDDEINFIPVYVEMFCPFEYVAICFTL